VFFGTEQKNNTFLIFLVNIVDFNATVVDSPVVSDFKISYRLLINNKHGSVTAL
jgi:hypothetical protein